MRKRRRSISSGRSPPTGNYTNARILVAKLYKKQGRIDDAKRQLEAVIHADRPHYRFTWERKYKPLAEQMLEELAEPASP